MRLNHLAAALPILLSVPHTTTVVSGQNATDPDMDPPTPTDPPPSGTDPAPGESSCSCTGCPESDRLFLGSQKNFVSPACPEGSVATLTTLRSMADHGAYKVTTWNTGAMFAELTVTDPYVYRQASTSVVDDDEEVTCYKVNDAVLPVVGDQPTIKVTLNCESVTYCDLKWHVEFGCAATGVLTADDVANGGGGGLQVLSDVDDTIKCSNPSTTCDSIASCTAEGTVSAYLAGTDRRLEHGEMYPGVAELMLGLALGPGSDGNNDDGGTMYVPAKPAMLSARPREAQFALAIDQDSDLNVYCEVTGDRYGHGSWGVNVDGSMYGTIFDGTDFAEFGETKARHYDNLAADKPNTRFAFLGDNGQGDLCAAQSMLESDAGDRMVAVLMQVVQDPSKQITECESPTGGDFTLDLPEGDRVHFFRTYSDAARWSFDKNLISCCSASNVYSAVDEFYECRCLGNCPPAQLPTGVSELATRNETLAYCDELKADQVILSEVVSGCDPTGSCAAPDDVPPSASSSSSAAAAPSGRFVSGVGSGIVLALVFGFLLP